MKSRSSATLTKNASLPQKGKNIDTQTSGTKTSACPTVVVPKTKTTNRSSAPPSQTVPENAVLLRCADGFGLSDSSHHDGHAPHPHRPPLRSLKTEDDVLRARIGSLGKAILHATPTPSLSVHAGDAPKSSLSGGGGHLRANTTTKPLSGTSGSTAPAHRAGESQGTAPGKKTAPSSSAVEKVDSIFNSSVGSSGSGVSGASKLLNAKPVGLAPSSSKKREEIAPLERDRRKSPVNENAAETTVRFVDPEGGNTINHHSISVISKNPDVPTVSKKPSTEEITREPIKMTVDPAKPISSRVNSVASALADERNSTASTFSVDNHTLHSIPSGTTPALGTLAEQHRAEEVECHASEVMTQRQEGPGVVLASSAAPLYDLSYASYLGKNTLKSKKEALESRKKEGSTTVPSGVVLDTLGGSAFSTLNQISQRQTMTMEEVANTLYLAARASRTSVDRNYYQVLHILWQSPMTGRGICTARANGDPLPTGAATHRRRRLEHRFLRDLYTRMPLKSSPLGNISSTARGLSSRPSSEIVKRDGNKLEQTTRGQDGILKNAKDEIRFSFLLRFELILVSSGDMFPGKLCAPRGRFDVSVDPMPEEEKDGPDGLGDFSTALPPLTARYADQCMDWRPLYPRVLGVHVLLPSSVIHTNPHLMDYAAILDGAIRPYHDRGGVVDDDLPERISFHVILAPSSVSSTLLPTIANPITPCYTGRSPLTNSVTGYSSAAQCSISSAAKADVLVMDTQSNPSQELIVVSASAHRHIRRRTLFGSGTVTSPHHKLHAVIYLNVQARRLSLNKGGIPSEDTLINKRKNTKSRTT